MTPEIGGLGSVTLDQVASIATGAALLAWGVYRAVSILVGKARQETAGGAPVTEADCQERHKADGKRLDALEAKLDAVGRQLAELATSVAKILGRLEERDRSVGLHPRKRGDTHDRTDF